MKRGSNNEKPNLDEQGHRSPSYLQAEQNHSAQELKTSMAAEQNFISNLLNQTQQKLKWN